MEKKELINETEKEEVIEKEEKEEKEEKGEETSFFRELLSWVMVFVGAFVVAYIITNYIIVNATVPTGSMKTTIMEGDKVIGFRLAYKFGDPKRGDIVMFNAPDKKGVIYIKRLIGMPGDHIKIAEGKLYINGKEQNEKYVHGQPTYAYDNYLQQDQDLVFECVVPKDCYFMMGDNRTGSSDSRVWGTVKRDELIAKAFIKWYPKVESLTK